MLYGEVFKDGLILEYHIMKMYVDRSYAEQIIIRVEKNTDRNAFAEFRLPSLQGFWLLRG